MRYKTIKQVNKKIYFNGLSPLGAMSSIILVIFSFLFFSWVGLFITGLPILYVSGKIAKETKKGNPGYLKSFLNFQSIKTVYKDNKNLMRYIS